MAASRRTLTSPRLWLALALAAALAMAGMLFAAVKPGAVHASTTQTYECTFSGAAGPINPPVPAILSTDPPFIIIGGEGDYSFDTGPSGSPPGDLECMYDDGSGLTGPHTGQIESHGSYENILCGTGEAYSRPGNEPPFSQHTHETTVTFDPGGPPDITTATYHIDFVAGQGELEITHVENDDNHSGTGEGTVVISPTVGDCVTMDVSQFEVEGEFTATLD